MSGGYLGTLDVKKQQICAGVLLHSLTKIQYLITKSLVT